MRFEKVYAVWDHYEGILAGVADFDGKPHVFNSLNRPWLSGPVVYPYRLSPVGELFAMHAERIWKLQRVWEKSPGQGAALPETNFAYYGNDPAYEESKQWLASREKMLVALPGLYAAAFRATPGRELAKPGGLSEHLEAAWTLKTDKRDMTWVGPVGSQSRIR